jgi:membrane-bound metal-dependent hydrolase YbcI (DUF457 family)
MLILAHTGITLGAAVLFYERAEAKHHRSVGKQKPTRILRFCWMSSFANRISMSLTYLAKSIDIRLLFFGAMLPDIIDKPLGQLVFQDSISNGRIFAHTLLFLIIVALAGFYVYSKRQQLWLLVIAFGVLTHLILDAMWQTPETMLWPLYGLAFPREELGGWALETLLDLIKNPAVYIPELIGVVILVWFVWFLLRRKKLLTFIKCGQIE